MASPADITITLSHEEVKMILLGETGTGKTSFIDLLHNFIKFHGKDFDIEEIDSITATTDADLEGYTTTTECIPYSFKSSDVNLSVVDTPGLSSHEEEDSSEKKIKNFLFTEPYINCICIVLNGTQARLQDSTRKSILRIACILPKQAISNVMVLFTNTVNRFHRSFRLEALSKTLGFPIDENHTYYVDNPFSHVQNVKSVKTGISKEDICNIKSNFGKTFITLETLCKKIMSLEQVNLKIFMHFIDLREEIERNLDELRLLQETKLRLEKKIEEISKDLQGEHLSFQKSDIVETDHYSTICEEPGCYSNCHHPCYFTGVIFKTVKDCKCIQDDGNCSICTHNYSQHHRRRYLYATSEVLISLKLHDKLAAAHSKEQQDRNLLEEQRNQLRELGYEEISDKLKKKLACLFAKFQNLGSIPYHKVIDIERNVLSRLSPAAQEAHKLLLCNIAEIHDIPLSKKLSRDQLYDWACNILNIDRNETINSDKIHKAHRNVSRRYCHAIKSGCDIIAKHHTHAKDFLLKLHG